MYCRFCGTYNEDNRAACCQCGAPLSQNMGFQQHCIQPNAAAYSPVRGSDGRVDDLPTNRGVLKYVFLSIITLGIYGAFVTNNMGNEINKTACRHDGKHTSSYLWVFLLSFFSNMVSIATKDEDSLEVLCFALFISVVALIVNMSWNIGLLKRVKSELRYRQIPYSITEADFWLWNTLGILILVGPFVYQHKLLTAVNKINEHHNYFGD